MTRPCWSKRYFPLCLIELGRSFLVRLRGLLQSPGCLLKTGSCRFENAMVLILLRGKLKKDHCLIWLFCKSIKGFERQPPPFPLFVIFILSLAAPETGETRRTKSGKQERRVTRKRKEGIDKWNNIDRDKKIFNININFKNDTFLPRAPWGKGPATKSDEFLEKFQTAFDPPSSFWKIMLQIFYNGYGRVYARRHRPDSAWAQSGFGSAWENSSCG